MENEQLLSIEETAEEPLLSVEETAEEPLLTAEEPLLAEESLLSVEEPLLIVEEPLLIVEEPLLTTEEPLLIVEEPLLTTEEPLLSVEETAEEPLLIVEEPLLTAEEPLLSVEEPLLSAEEPLLSTTEEPLLSAMSVIVGEPSIILEKQDNEESTTDEIYKLLNDKNDLGIDDILKIMVKTIITYNKCIVLDLEKIIKGVTKETEDKCILNVLDFQTRIYSFLFLTNNKVPNLAELSSKALKWFVCYLAKKNKLEMELFICKLNEHIDYSCIFLDLRKILKTNLSSTSNFCVIQ